MLSLTIYASLIYKKEEKMIVHNTHQSCPFPSTHHWYYPEIEDVLRNVRFVHRYKCDNQTYDPTQAHHVERTYTQPVMRALVSPQVRFVSPYNHLIVPVTFIQDPHNYFYTTMNPQELEMVTGCYGMLHYLQLRLSTLVSHKDTITVTFRDYLDNQSPQIVQLIQLCERAHAFIVRRSPSSWHTDMRILALAISFGVIEEKYWKLYVSRFPKFNYRSVLAPLWIYYRNQQALHSSSIT